MPTIPTQPGRFALLLICALLFVGCGASTPTLESIGLATEWNLEAGTTFDLPFPKEANTDVRVASAPPGIMASVETGPDPDSNLLSVAVDSDTARGSYTLGISVSTDGKETVLSWPFEVVDRSAP